MFNIDLCFPSNFRMDDMNTHTSTVTFTVSVAGIDDEAPTMTSHTNMQVINQDENDEPSNTAVAITLEGKRHLMIWH